MTSATSSTYLPEHETQIRENLEQTLHTAKELQQIVWELSSARKLISFFERSRNSDILSQFHKMMLTAFNPVCTITGYLDGLEARTLLRESLLSQSPEKDAFASLSTQFSSIATTLDVLVRALEDLNKRTSFAPLPKINAKPGPLRVSLFAKHHMHAANLTFCQMILAALGEKHAQHPLYLRAQEHAANASQQWSQDQ
ncbi:MAG: hypothetical protein H6727_04090 [Myxococcales bacterium]|nr:hypothetical protein [Myxococcales bacterium]